MSKYLVKDVCKVKGGKRIPKGETLQTEPNEHPYIRILDMYQGKVLNLDSSMMYARNDYWNRIKAYTVNAGDVILAIVGNTLGMVSMIGDSLDGANLTENCCKFANLDVSKVLPEFLYYVLSNDKAQKEIERFKVGSSQPKLPIYNVEQIEIPDYSIAYQKKMVDLLGCIDAKISNNKAIYSDLDAMVKLLYDYWFVQFDFPDENGKPYKSSGGKMIWNEALKREIPDGWEVVPYSEVISSINTGLNPRDNFRLNTGGQIKYLTVKNLLPNGNIDFSACDLIDEEARRIVHKRSDIKIGDILFASISPLGRCHIIWNKPEDWDINESVFSIRPDYNNVNSAFLYLSFTSDYFIKLAEGNSTGSVFKGIRITELLGLKTILPPKPLLDRFNEYVYGLFDLKSNTMIENQELTSLRDFLLPMLMNGQVTVKKGETQ